MKPLLLVTGILALAVGPARAQEAPAAPATAQAKNGYGTLVAAGKLIKPGENGGPSATELTLEPAENLRRQRLAVARNAPALALARQALSQPFDVPIATDYGDMGLSELARFRELARQLRQESDVRLADGDSAGALDSRLTIIEMGAAIARDAPFTASLTGTAIEYIGRDQIEPIVAQLNAAQIRGALARLQKLEAQRPTYAQVLSNEQKTTLSLMLGNMKQLKAQIATPASRKEAGLSDEDARELGTLDLAQLETQIATAFETVIARDRLPYRAALAIEIAPAASELARSATDLYRDPRLRAYSERDRANNLLFQAALQLRAIWLETGQYPAIFAAPTDPFALPVAPLIYRRENDRYRLYSVGPDGGDDGGAELQTPEGEGEEKWSTLRYAASTGDIVAPVFQAPTLN